MAATATTKMSARPEQLRGDTFHSVTFGVNVVEKAREKVFQIQRMSF